MDFLSHMGVDFAMLVLPDLKYRSMSIFVNLYVFSYVCIYVDMCMYVSHPNSKRPKSMAQLLAKKASNLPCQGH